MKHLLLVCSDTDAPRLAPLAVQNGYGLELTSFCHPDRLRSFDDLVDTYQRDLQGFSGVLSIHGAFSGLLPASIDPWVSEATAARMRQAIGFTEQMSASHLILHLGYTGRSRFDQGWVDRSIEYWSALLAQTPPTVWIHLENVFEPDPAMQLAVMDGVNDPRLGMCLDIGHVPAFSQTTHSEWINAFGSRITYVHIHDNDGTADQHKPLGQGTIPMAETLHALEEAAPDAIWMIEAEAEPSLDWLTSHGFLP